MNSTDFYQIDINTNSKPIDLHVQLFVIGLVFGVNLTILLTTAARVMEWCSDPLASKLQDRIDDLDEENNTHLGTIQDLGDQLEELEQEVEKLNNRLEEEQDENEELYDLISDLTSSAASYRKKNANLREKIADLREIVRIRREVDADSDECPQKRRRVDDMK